MHSALDVTIVLNHPLREANIGATARAMKTMGYTRLVLVAPAVELSREAFATAHGSTDVLENARQVETLAEAVHDHPLVIGTTVRRGKDRMTPVRLRKFVSKVLPAYLPTRLAVVFGSEESGLSNTDLEHCQFAVEIPTGPLFHSLNLSHAVMVVCYELAARSYDVDPDCDRENVSSEADPPDEEAPEEEQIERDGLDNRTAGAMYAARRARLDTLYRGTQQFLEDVGYPSSSSLARAMADLHRVLEPTWMTQRDVDTILGMYRHIRWLLRQHTP